MLLSNTCDLKEYILDVIICEGRLRYRTLQGRIIVNEGKTTSKTFL